MKKIMMFIRKHMRPRMRVVFKKDGVKAKCIAFNTEQWELLSVAALLSASDVLSADELKNHIQNIFVKALCLIDEISKGSTDKKAGVTDDE